jgi:hypothetical protein
MGLVSDGIRSAQETCKRHNILTTTLFILEKETDSSMTMFQTLVLIITNLLRFYDSYYDMIYNMIRCYI